MDDIQGRLEKVVANLADPLEWRWTKAPSERQTADRVLVLLAEHGLIECQQHVFGGYVWIINGNIYGRTD